MNPFTGRQWMFRWGQKAGMKILPGLPRCWFRGAPLIAWLAGMAVHDLRKPDSRIRAVARHLLENRRVLQLIRTVVVGSAQSISQHDARNHPIEGKAIRVLEKRDNGKDR